MRPLVLLLIGIAAVIAAQPTIRGDDDFSADHHEALQFLIKHLPPIDTGMDIKVEEKRSLAFLHASCDRPPCRQTLEGNVILAEEARRATRWAAVRRQQGSHTIRQIPGRTRVALRNDPRTQAVPWPMFLNNVLPHAILDEPRDG